jgi:hypothetical protein
MSFCCIACSDDDDNLQTPTIPLGEVTLQASQPDNVTLSVPQTASIATNDGTTVVSYANGQELSFKLDSSKSSAILTSIDGTAGTVVVPSSITLSDNTLFTVDSIGVDNTEYSTLCESVNEIVLPKTIKSSVSTYTRRLANFPNLERIKMESGFVGFNSINGAVYTDDLKTLVYCPKGRMGEFSIANGTETISSHAFYGASNLTRVVIPSSVKNIEANSFDYNTHLQVINVLATTIPNTAELAFGYYARHATLVVPQGCLDSYKSNVGFKYFSNFEQYNY